MRHGRGAQPAPAAWPSRAALAALAQVVQLGYYRGILNQLDAINAANPACAFVTGECAPGPQFQFEAMARALGQAPQPVDNPAP
jgi:hypothetical protein